MSPMLVCMSRTSKCVTLVDFFFEIKHSSVHLLWGICDVIELIVSHDTWCVLRWFVSLRGNGPTLTRRQGRNLDIRADH